MLEHLDGDGEPTSFEAAVEFHGTQNLCESHEPCGDAFDVPASVKIELFLSLVVRASKTRFESPVVSREARSTVLLGEGVLQALWGLRYMRCVNPGRGHARRASIEVGRARDLLGLATATRARVLPKHTGFTTSLAMASHGGNLS